MTIPEQRDVLVHRGRNHRPAVLHEYPDTPWNDVVEYKFSLTHMAGVLFQRVFGQRHGEVKIPKETQADGTSG